MKLWVKMLLGLVLGVVAGMLLKENARYLKPVGTIFLGLLHMLVILLVFSSMTVGVTSINDPKKLGRVGLKTIGMYAMTTAVALVIGLFFAKLFNPGNGIGLTHESVNLSIDETPELLNLLLSMIPKNPIASLANGNILQIIVFAIFFGLGITFAGEKGKPILRAMESLSDVMFQMTGMVMSMAPYGIFAIMAWITGSFGSGVLYPLLKFIMAHYIACIVHAVLVFGFILKVMSKLRLRPFFKGMGDAITLAASTTSSSATLPATLHCTQQNLGVSKNIASFVLPLGATMNMNGTAIFQAIAAVFISQAYGITLGWESLLMIVVTATLSAVGTAGIPGGALVTLSIILGSVGLPIEGIALVAGIDRIRDIVGTAVNVMGDSVVSVWVAKSEGELDIDQYNNGEVVGFEHATTEKNLG
ncbi:MAG: dicarboxylate/amino acid:cation symporter [Chlamydiia bacterium]|nr:dicarboxylate/amino acid:cation symporter [Chlamydiia bacterium]